MSFNEKEVLTKLSWDHTRPLGDVWYHKLHEVWGEFEELIVELLPGEVRAYHMIKTGNQKKNVAEVAFTRDDNGTLTPIQGKTTEGKLPEQVLEYLHGRIRSLRNRGVRGLFRPLHGWQ